MKQNQTSRAKYYIYRNLHTNTFSVRYKGIVIAHPTSFIAKNIIFKVNKKGREKVLQTRSKNVHAFVVCEEWKDSTDFRYTPGSNIYYNPYVTETFIFAGQHLINYPIVFGVNGKELYLHGKEV